MRSFLILATLSLITIQTARGQSIDAFKKSAAAAYAEKDYPTAFVHSRIILEEEPENITYLKIAAEAALAVYAYQEADLYLSRIESLHLQEPYPLLDFFRAKLHHRQGEYEKAGGFYQKFLSEQRNSPDVDPYYIALAEQKLEECSNDRDALLTPAQGVTIAKAGGDINTPYSDFVRLLTDDSLYVASLEPIEECGCVKACQDQTQLYHTTDPEYGAKTRMGFPETFKNVGDISYANEGNRMYFTQCACEKDQYTCALYYRDRAAYGSAWGPAVSLPAAVNQPESTVSQPFFQATAADEGRLYYTSNYSGSGARGGTDIWYVDVKGEEFSAPVNAGAINTSGDEVTPFYHEPTATFYFSSNGRAGLGGYDFDVYKVEGDASYWGTPVNVGSPVNSLYDDLSFFLNAAGDGGYVSSNRDGQSTAYGNTELQHCCPDIYKIDIARRNLIVSVYCKSAMDRKYEKEPVNDVELTVNAGGERLTAGEVEANRFSYAGIPTENPLLIMAGKEGYRPAEVTVNPLENEEDDIEIDIFLEPIITLEVYVKDRNDPYQDVLINTIMLIDSTKGGSAITLQRNASNVYSYELSGYSEYLIDPICSSIDDKRYRFDTIDARIRVATTCLPETIRKTIWLQIPQIDTIALTEPLPLYFAHAVPKIEGYGRREAAKDYNAYYEEYLVQKKDFLAFAADCNAGDNAYGQYAERDSIGKAVVEAFFSEMEFNRQELDTFATMLLNRLVIGDSAIIAIKGVASKAGGGRGYNNDDLSERRIDSMKKYLDDFFQANRGAYKYNTQDLIGRVKFIPEPVGDSIASKNAPTTGPCRIYSIEASRDRRIEITSIIFNPGDPKDDPCLTEASSTSY